ESIPAQTFSGADEMLDALESGDPSVLVTDVRMPGKDGLALLQEIKQRYPELPVIVMTAYTDLSSTVSAFKKGAFDYLAKPFDINDAVALIQRAMPVMSQPEASVADVPAFERVDAETVPQVMMKSASVVMQEVFRAIGRLA